MMDDEIVTAVNELLGHSRTLTPAMVWCWTLDRHIPYRTVVRTLEAMAERGYLECIDPFALAYRRSKPQPPVRHAESWWRSAERSIRRRRAAGRGMRSARATPRLAV